MSKIAFLYPGQGAQYVGMGKDLYENNAKAKQYFDGYDKIIKQITKPNNINKYILGAIEIKEER
mgnify:CR=1 FL=1